MQAELTPNQQHPYQTTPSPHHAQYNTNGNLSDPRHQSLEYGTGQTNGIMNPYQQYSAGYPQQHSSYAQQPQQTQPQPAQAPQQQQARPFMPTQLPPLGAQMSSMPPPSQYGALPQQTMSHPQSHQSLAPPPSRSAASSQPQDKKLSHSMTRGGLKYSLAVVQQPARARMCGFGDKDRRPITPPPCVRLVIQDEDSGREIDVSEIQSDPSFFVLQVDLWAESADREANVVRASSNSPAVSISSATTTSYPPPAEAPRHMEQPLMYVGADGHPMYATSVSGYAVPLARPGMMYPQHPSGMYYPNVPGQAISYMQPAQQSSSAMYTRNLIGSLTVNASRLTDTEGKAGYWFVLQDLSVRTEGFFRLRMSFIDISNNGAPGVNRGKAPVLAWAFSDKFQVYSAKKFPGVIESTPLSKCFASQGIKIPIRKDNKGDANDDDDGDI